MLYAKTPSIFAKFISVLCEDLSRLVIKNGGVMDKFTGDGVLAFFPKFYSGEDAGYRAIKTATEAIRIFDNHYHKNGDYFQLVIESTGLGVGIDYGKVEFVNIGGSLSIVGTPVVFACRCSGTRAGTICANQSAKEILSEKYEAYTTLEETSLQVKNCGPVRAYFVQIKEKKIKLEALPWEELIED